MHQHELHPTHRRKAATRVGRGIAAGGGKTAGRGTKGQKSRTGANSNIPRTFRGGSTPLVQSLPKLKGFTSRATKTLAINMDRIQPLYKENDTVTLISLIEKNLISPKEALQGVKILRGRTAKSHSLKFEEDNPHLTFSKSLLVS